MLDIRRQMTTGRSAEGIDGLARVEDWGRTGSIALRQDSGSPSRSFKQSKRERPVKEDNA